VIRIGSKEKKNNQGKKMRPLNTQRRDFFRYMTLLGLAGFSAVPLHAAGKAKQSAVQYQDTPKDGKKCSDCVHFISKTNECKVVEGTVDPDGWCSLFVLPPKKG
jgi:hypothetical protein